jgi:hypothetical protein
MIFQCAACKEAFEQDGLQLILHEENVLRICPGCLANSNSISLTISRRAPGRPFKLVLLQTEADPLFYEVKNNETQGD